MVATELHIFFGFGSFRNTQTNDFCFVSDLITSVFVPQITRVNF